MVKPSFIDRMVARMGTAGTTFKGGSGGRQKSDHGDRPHGTAAQGTQRRNYGVVGFCCWLLAFGFWVLAALPRDRMARRRKERSAATIVLLAFIVGFWCVLLLTCRLYPTTAWHGGARNAAPQLWSITLLRPTINRLRT